MLRDHRTNGLSSIPSATGGIARLAYERLRDAGIDPTAIVLDAGLTVEDILDRKRRLEAGAQMKLLDLGAREAQDDCFGFHLARDFKLGEIGLVYYVMSSSERLSDALLNAERYCAVNNEGVRLKVSAERGFAIGLEYVNIDRLSDRQHMEFWLVALLRVCRTVSSSRIVPKQIKLRHFRPNTPPEIRSHLGCEIDFAAERDEILFPSAIGSLPVVGADEHLNKLLRQYADEALSSRLSKPAGIRSQVEEKIAQLLPHAKANASEIAGRLGMSRRTLARALSAEGAVFSGVLETLRRALAIRYLEERELAISEIAWLLGYSEVSSFTHAFARWTGLTPKAFRNSKLVR